MKKEIISIFTIALLTLSSNLALPVTALAQNNVQPAEKPEEKTPFFQGGFVGIDVFGLMNKVLGSDVTGSEISLEANLKNTYFPVVEIGYASTDATNDETEIYYKTAAPYFRVGAGYNVFKDKPYLPGQLLVGLRYGFTSFSYDVKAPDLVDPNWGNTVVSYAYEGVKSNVSWLELTVGMKAKVYGGFYLGFNARYRNRLSLKKHENTEPLYIPGFGKNGTSNFGVTYSIIYKLPL